MKKEHHQPSQMEEELNSIPFDFNPEDDEIDTTVNLW